MDDVQLKQIVEALLFVSDKPLTLKQVAELCEGVNLPQIKKTIQALTEHYNTPERGVQLIEVAGGYQFTTHPDCAEYLKKLYTTHRTFRLSAPALETMAIIAYKQPVTRAEMEFIRGVNVDGVIKTLEDRDLIKIKGRKEVPGKPILYGTTDEFLHHFGLRSLEDLPSIEEFTARALENAAIEQTQTRELADASAEQPGAPAENPEPPLMSDTTAEQHIRMQPESGPDEAESAQGENDYGHDEHSEIAKSN